MQQPKWQVAMTAELTTLISHGTWIPKPPNANVIGNKWVFKLKHKADGIM
jgi:histone deacetylase 1/2